MAYSGGVAVISLQVTPADGTTTVTVEAVGPDDTILNPVPTSTDSTNWTAYFVPTAAGLWVATWTVDGTGEGLAPQEVWVATAPSPAAAVSWRPLLEDVAAYVPTATLVGAVDGYGAVLYTWDDTTTHPTAGAAQRIITGACSWVLVGTGPLDVALLDGAKDLAARRAAGWIQFTFVDDADDRAHAETLLKQCEADLLKLAKRNSALTGDDPTDPADDVMPDVWYPTVDYC